MANIAALIKTITKIVGDDKEFSYKASRDKKIRVMIPDKTTYKALRDRLDTAGKRFYTFQPRDERAFRIVVKGLYHTTFMDFFKEEFIAQSYTVREAHNAIGHRSKTPLPLFFINLEPASYNLQGQEAMQVCGHCVPSNSTIYLNATDARAIDLAKDTASCMRQVWRGTRQN